MKGEAVELFDALDLGIFHVVLDSSSARFEFLCQCQFTVFDPMAWLWWPDRSGWLLYRNLFGEEHGPPPDTVQLCATHADLAFKRAYVENGTAAR